MEAGLQKNIDNLPPLPESIQAVEKVYHDKESSFVDMKQVIEQDPMLTANILKAANAPMYGFNREIKDVQQAISLFGKDAVRSFALETAVQQSFALDLSPYGMNEQDFKNASEKQMALVINWLIRKEPKSLALLAPAAFMVDLGRVVISRFLIEEGKADAITKATQRGADIDIAEREACGSQTTDITATIFNHWHFEPELIHLIRYSDDPESLSDDEQHLAAILKSVREAVNPNGTITDDSLENARETIEEFDLDLESFESAVAKVEGLE